MPNRLALLFLLAFIPFTNAQSTNTANATVPTATNGTSPSFNKTDLYEKRV